MAAVTLYTTSWCGECRVAKRYFDDRAVPYREIDIEHWDDPRGRLEEITGGRTVPQIVVGDRVVDYGAFRRMSRSGEMDALVAGLGSADGRPASQPAG
jgi:mycoredoxin